MSCQRAIETHLRPIVSRPLSYDRGGVGTRYIEGDAVVINTGLTVDGGTRANPLGIRAVGNPGTRQHTWWQDLRRANTTAGWQGNKRVVWIGSARSERDVARRTAHACIPNVGHVRAASGRGRNDSEHDGAGRGIVGTISYRDGDWIGARADDGAGGWRLGAIQRAAVVGGAAWREQA